MSISASDVVPLTQARANLSELADQVKAGAERIITKNGESYMALIDADQLDYYHCLERSRSLARVPARQLSDPVQGSNAGPPGALAVHSAPPRTVFPVLWAMGRPHRQCRALTRMGDRRD